MTSALFHLTTAIVVTAAVVTATPIDREALVRRNQPSVNSVDFDAPLTVGNGGFAFTADITGLQTFAPDYHRHGVPTETQARWAWVSDDNPQGYTLADAGKPFTHPDGRVVSYPTQQESPAGKWLRRNPRAQPVGQLQLVLDKADGSAIRPQDIVAPAQTLDLWSGVITSRYQLAGAPVNVTTACDPDSDTVAVRLESELAATGALRVRLAFPRGHDLETKNTPALDWSGPERHASLLDPAGVIRREVGGTEYFVICRPSPVPAGPHAFEFRAPAGNPVIELTVRFSPATAASVPAAGVFERSADHWRRFWRETAAVDCSGSTNPLAAKLERRIILSRYLTAVQNVGDVPPQESGLTCNTWYGKHHTEMIWWHTAHFALWGQDAALARNLDWFMRQLPAARELAASRSLRGARWAKMTGPEMRESPGGNPLIVWNQPHPIYLAELLYRNSPTVATLGKYRNLVLETADCMASMPHWDAAKRQYDLGPPLWIAQELYDQATSRNPSFELAYWRWSLGVAQQWRERLGLPRDKTWDHVSAHLAPLPAKDGRYVALGSHPDTWDNPASRHDHPTMLAPIGLLPETSHTNRAVMERTLDAVLANWDWETKIWGWDYPLIAMTATRLGRPQAAVEILLRDGPNNCYLPNGHCPQRSDGKFDSTAPPGARKREIAAYLPANGAFLAAVALMVAGWDGVPVAQPGIPADGTWQVRAEGLHRLP
jgi:hypothetical protein